MFADTSIWTGAAALASSAATLVVARFTGKQSRQTQLEAFKDEVYRRVEAELAECRKGHARVLVVETCLRLAIPELIAHDRSNPVLRQISALLQKLPIEPDTPDDWAGLMERLRQEPYP